MAAVSFDTLPLDVLHHTTTFLTHHDIFHSWSGVNRLTYALSTEPSVWGAIVVTPCCVRELELLVGQYPNIRAVDCRFLTDDESARANEALSHLHSLEWLWAFRVRSNTALAASGERLRLRANTCGFVLTHAMAGSVTSLTLNNHELGDEAVMSMLTEFTAVRALSVIFRQRYNMQATAALPLSLASLFPKLHTLKLTGLIVGAEEWSVFVNSHPQLCSLAISNVSLPEVEWDMGWVSGGSVNDYDGSGDDVSGGADLSGSQCAGKEESEVATAATTTASARTVGVGEQPLPLPTTLHSLTLTSFTANDEVWVACLIAASSASLTSATIAASTPQIVRALALCSRLKKLSMHNSSFSMSESEMEAAIGVLSENVSLSSFDFRSSYTHFLPLFTQCLQNVHTLMGAAVCDGVIAALGPRLGCLRRLSISPTLSRAWLSLETMETIGEYCSLTHLSITAQRLVRPRSTLTAQALLSPLARACTELRQLVLCVSGGDELAAAAAAGGQCLYVDFYAAGSAFTSFFEALPPMRMHHVAAGGLTPLEPLYEFVGRGGSVDFLELNTAPTSSIVRALRELPTCRAVRGDYKEETLRRGIVLR